MSELERFGNLARILSYQGVTPLRHDVPEMLLGADWATGYNEQTETWDLYPIEYTEEDNEENS